MPNCKQAAKRLRQADARRQENKMVRTAMRTAIKRVLRAESADDAAKLLPMATKRIDKAAKKGVIHANAAARYKRRIARAGRAVTAADTE
jgi:small subunit ribosomal protein S20